MALYPKVSIRGTERLIEYAREQKKNIRKTILRAVQGASIFVQKQTDELFQSSEDQGLFFKGDRGVYWTDRVGEESYKHPKLIKSGKLRRSIRRESRVFKRGSGRWYMYGRVYADLNQAPWANRQQFGDPAKNVPARPYLFVNEEEERYIGDIFAAKVGSIFQ